MRSETNTDNIAPNFDFSPTALLLKKQLIDNRSPSTDTYLPADGYYQLSPATLGKVNDEVVTVLASSIRRARRLPRLIVAWGKCRTGSTPLTNLFGMAGITSYYQPVKTVARHVLAGGHAEPWGIPSDEDVIFCKEMAGPYTHYECVYNPIDLLIRSGWPTDRLHLLVLDRDPGAAFRSWADKWASRIGRARMASNFYLSSLNYGPIREYAARNGVACTSYPYEIIRSGEVVVQQLFSELGLADHFKPDITRNWGETGDLNSNHAALHYPIEPEQYHVSNLHRDSSAGYAYVMPRTDQLEGDEREIVTSDEVVSSYQTSITEARKWAGDFE